MENKKTYFIKDKQYSLPNLEYKTDVKFLDKSYLDELYDLMKFLHNLFEKHGIYYVAIAGTLISCVRHKAFMPWDDDIDIAVWHEDRNRIWDLKKEISKTKYVLYYSNWSTVIKHKQKHGIAVDIFELSRDPKDDMYKYGCPYDVNGKPEFVASTYFPKEIYYEKNLKNRKLAKLCDLYIWIPYDPIFLLKKHYNNRVMKEVYASPTEHIHQLRKYSFLGQYIDVLPITIQKKIVNGIFSSA